MVHQDNELYIPKTREIIRCEMERLIETKGSKPNCPAGGALAASERYE
jgi:hypothetical protein